MRRSASPNRFRPVADFHVDAIRAYVAPQVWTMIELQRMTGARPGEIVIMRGCDLDMSGRVWLYRPSTHKGEHRGHDRIIYIGPKAQGVLRPWLRPELTAFLFSPAEAMDLRREALRAARKTKVQPSQSNRRKRRTQVEPSDAYTVLSYGRAIARACRLVARAALMAKGKTKEEAEEAMKKDGYVHWHPHQLRHNAATRLRQEFGIEAARLILGHRSPLTTEIYAEVDQTKAVEIMARSG